MEKSFLAVEASKRVMDICSMTNVIPVLTVTNLEDAIPLANAITGGGLPVLEITLRTENALHVIKEINRSTEALVGAGTLITKKDVKNAVAAGAKFGVSPGVTEDLAQACEDEGLPLIGGVSSASEAMKMLERGYELMKFFPAESSGGVKALKAIGGPLPQVSFCPTGGISVENATGYLAQDNVVCIGGSWMANSSLIKAKDWEMIHDLASEASRIGTR